MNPGLIALTRTPSFTPRSASALVSSRHAALTLPPMVNSALPVRPPTPMMLTMVPLLAIRCFQAARLRRMAPKNFSAKPSSQSASVSSKKSPRLVAPALLTSRSILPNFATVASTTAAAASCCRKSTACTRQSVPSDFARSSS